MQILANRPRLRLFAGAFLATCLVFPAMAQGSQRPAIGARTVAGQPSGSALPSGLRSARLAVSTDKAANCRFDSTDRSWSRMAGSFTTTGGSSHNVDVALTEGNSYTYFVRCQDEEGNESSAAAVSWTTGARGDGCVTEGAGIQNREDVVFCEGFETSDWWQKPGWFKDNTRYETRAPVTSAHVGATSVITDGCMAGNCLKVNVGAGGCCGLAIVWEIDSANVQADEVYLRYYMKLAPNFDPTLCNSDGQPIGGSGGGKMPGLSDATTSNDADELCPGGTCDDAEGGTCSGGSRDGKWCGQCGNGGIPGDEYTCWSGRSNFRNCYNACENHPNAKTRFGWYLYSEGNPLGSGRALQWDADDYAQEPGCPGGFGCGLTDDEGLENDRWYRIEQHVKMNTPGQNDGVMRGWIDGVLRYEKTNVYFRAVGHDNVHVRNFWFILFFGGSLVGPCEATHAVFDQVVIATDGGIGDVAPADIPIPPANLQPN